MADKKNQSAINKKREPRGGYTKVYNAFIDTDQLTQHEKMVFIAIKSFANNKTNEAFPSLATISRVSGVSIPHVRKCISKMQDMKILKVEKRKNAINEGNISNLYTVYDSPDMWNEDFITEDEDYMAVAQELPDHVLEEEYKRRHLETKKELSENSDQTKHESTSSDLNVINTTFNYKNNEDKSQQSERYSLEQIKIIYNYDILVNDNPDLKEDIEIVINILYDTLNTTRETIRVAGENKPSMVVIGRLMKLTYDEIKYSIDTFKKQTNKIEHQYSYMLTLLYKAHEQFHLDVTNQVQHDLYGQ